MAHAMKTPLTVIKGYSATMRRRLEGDAGEMAGDIEQAADRVTRILNQLVDVWRLESETMAVNPRRVEVVGLVDDVVSRFGRSEGQTISFEAPEHDLHCIADETSLRRSLEELLRNARQYSAAGKPITVETAVSAGQVEVAVRDEGSGISEDDLPRITEKHFRAAGAPGEGLGLGLYIADRSLARQNGRLEAESTLGQGSTMRVILPQATGG